MQSVPMAMSSTTKIAITVGVVAVIGALAYYFVSEAKKKKAAEEKIATDKSAAFLLSANMKAQSMTPTISAETKSAPPKNSAETRSAPPKNDAETRSAPPESSAQTKAAPPKDEPARASSNASRIMLSPDLQRKASAARAASILTDDLPFSAISSFVLPKGTYSWSDGPTFNAKRLLLTNHSGHSVQMKTPSGPFTLENDAQYWLPTDAVLNIPNPN